MDKGVELDPYPEQKNATAYGEAAAEIDAFALNALGRTNTLLGDCN